ncbi:hypothetical protein ACPV5U_19070 [Vibrio mediterranei]
MSQSESSTYSKISSEPVENRRMTHLRSVDVQSKLHVEFAEKYGFMDDEGKAEPEKALAHLDGTFFREWIDKGHNLTNFQRIQVVQFALETELNPFNNEIYGVRTPFGDLKVQATIDGWNKIATHEEIIERNFKYSEDEVEGTVGQGTYLVPKWIECTIVHKTKGTSVAREYFKEVFDASQHHLPSWTRPARMLSHVAFIQALRRLLRVNGLGDSDIISDMTKEYERLMALAEVEKVKATNEGNTDIVQDTQSASKMPIQPRSLNIDLDSVVIEEEPQNSTKSDEATTETPPLKVDVVVAEDKVDASVETSVGESEDLPKKIADSVRSPEQSNAEEDLIDDVYINRTILQMFKPMFEQVIKRQLTKEALIARRVMIKDPLALQWFDQKLAAL